MARRVEIVWSANKSNQTGNSRRIRAELDSQESVLDWCRKEAAKRNIPLHEYLKQARQQ